MITSVTSKYFNATNSQMDSDPKSSILVGKDKPRNLQFNILLGLVFLVASILTILGLVGLVIIIEKIQRKDESEKRIELTNYNKDGGKIYDIAN